MMTACRYGYVKSYNFILKLLFDIQASKRLCKNIKFSYLRRLFLEIFVIY